jgi:hypothetical protein
MEQEKNYIIHQIFQSRMAASSRTNYHRLYCAEFYIEDTMSFNLPPLRSQVFDNEINFLRETASHWHRAFLREADTARKLQSNLSEMTVYIQRIERLVYSLLSRVVCQS